jgi:hypothetical protein
MTERGATHVRAFYCHTDRVFWWPLSPVRAGWEVEDGLNPASVHDNSAFAVLDRSFEHMDVLASKAGGLKHSTERVLHRVSPSSADLKSTTLDDVIETTDRKPMNYGKDSCSFVSDTGRAQ